MNGTNDLNNYLSIIILVFIIFGSSLNNDFIFDDHEALVKNRDLTSMIDKQRIFDIDVFKHDFWGNDIKSSSSHKSYRPMTIITYRLIWKFENFLYKNQLTKLDPFYFHLFNILSYCFLCCYLYYTLKLFFDSSLISIEEFQILSLKITILFLLHPIHCEPVSSCVGLADILSAIFSLVSTNIFLKYIDTIYSRQWNSLIILNLIQIIFFSAISIFFKEQGITSLGFLIFLSFKLLMRKNRDHSKIRNHKMILFTTILILVVATFILMYLRLWIMGFKLPIFSKMDNPSANIENTLFRYINYFYIYLLNTFIIICPLWLSFDWSMGCIPIIHSFEDIRFVFVMIFLIISSIFFLGVLLRHSWCELGHSLIVFSMFSIITFLPASNLFFPVGFVIAERNLFLSILGYIVIFVLSHHHISKSFPNYKKILNYGLYLIMLMLAVKSFKRNLDWNNELKLFEKDVLVCPGNAKIYYNIGKISADQGDKTKAVEYYRKSISLYENYTSALNNLANILKDDNQFMEARTLLEKACMLDPKFAAGWMNLATVEMSLNNFDKSEIYFSRAIKIRPNHAFTHFNLGNLYIKQKKFKKAEYSFNEAIKLDKKLTKAWHNLILLKQNLNQLSSALEIATEALNYSPNDDSLHFLKANILGQDRNRFQQAEYHFKEAIRLNPNKSIYFNNLAVLYHRNGNHPLAIEYYSKTIKLNPEHKNAIENLKILLKNK